MTGMKASPTQCYGCKHVDHDTWLRPSQFIDGAVQEGTEDKYAKKTKGLESN